MDFNQPDNFIKAMVKLRASIDGAPALWWYQGTQYGVVDLEPTVLWQVEGAQLAKFEKRDDGSFDHIFRDVMFFTDKDTGQMIETFDNPYTGEKNNVPIARMGPFSVRMSGTEAVLNPPKGIPMDSMDVSWQYEPSVIQGDDLYIRERGRTRIRKGPPGTDDFFHINDLLTMVGPVSEIEDDERPGAAARNMYQSFNDWTPWMGMGDRPGFVLGRGNGRKLSSFDELPEKMLALIEEHEPGFFGDTVFELWDRSYHPVNNDA